MDPIPLTAVMPTPSSPKPTPGPRGIHPGGQCPYTTSVALYKNGALFPSQVGMLRRLCPAHATQYTCGCVNWSPLACVNGSPLACVNGSPLAWPAVHPPPPFVFRLRLISDLLFSCRFLLTCWVFVDLLGFWGGCFKIGAAVGGAANLALFARA